jgi:hypothetical protein
VEVTVILCQSAKEGDMAERTDGQGAKFRAVLRMLRKECKISRPIKVISKDLNREKLCGCCIAYLDDNGKVTRFAIEVDSNLAPVTAIDTLLHEWAHALDQVTNGVTGEPHRSSWGKCYARVWRAYVSKIID